MVNDKKKGILKIIADGRITLPKEAREEWGLEEGDHVQYEIKDGVIQVRPIEIIHKKVEKLKEISKEKGEVFKSAKAAIKSIESI